jgi:hypothetical protein
MRTFTRWFLVTAIVLFVLPVVNASAAEMRIDRSPNNPTSVLKISGVIEKDDAQKFVKLAEQVPILMVIVQLSSPGGELTSGLAIGEQIRIRGYSTFVRAGEPCASACALAWLAGDFRYMDPTALVGFHAASRKDGIQRVESGEANALVGAYLGSLGLTSDAIRYITRPSPAEVQWLTIKDAMKLGINVTIANEKQLAQ